MANFPTSLPSSTPADHGVVKDEVIAIATEVGLRRTFVSGGWYTQQMPHTFASATHSIGVLVLSPYYFLPGQQIVELGEWMTTVAAAGGLRRLCIYNDTSNQYPGSLLLDAGTYDSTTSAGTLKSPGAFTALTVGGWKWIGAVTTVATCVTIGVNSTLPGVGGTATVTLGDQARPGFQQTGVTGALPDPFTTTRTHLNNAPRIWFKTA